MGFQDGESGSVEGQNEIDCDYTDEITCPYCGKECRDSWEKANDGDVDCECGRTYSYSRDVSVSYCSYEK